MNKHNTIHIRVAQDINNHISQWKLKAKLSEYQIWQKCDDHTIAEAYPIRDIRGIQRHLRWHKPHIVKMLGLTPSTKQHRAYILLQRLPNRLSQCVSLNEHQALKILYSIFKGLEQLMPNFGIIGLVQGCVCFNETGKIRIWVNPDLSSEIPIKNYNTNNLSLQKIAIWDSIEMIERKCFNEHIFLGIKKYIQNGRIKSFHDAIKQVQKIADSLFIDLDQRIKQKQPVTSIHQDIKPVSNSKKNIQQSYMPRNDFYKTTGDVGRYQKQHQQTTPLQKIYDILKTLKGQDNNCDKYRENKNYHQQNKQHSKNNQNHHRRYYSYFESAVNNHNHSKVQMPSQSPSLKKMEAPSFEVQKKNFDGPLLPLNSQKQRNQQAYRSAPQSPRQVDPKNFTKKGLQQPQSNKLLQKIKLKNGKQSRKASVNQKKQEINSHRLVPKQIQDSFSHNIRNQSKQIEMIGEFQTFGFLQGLSEKKLEEPKQQNQKIQIKDKNVSNCFQDLNIQQMDKEISRKLQKKSNNLHIPKGKHTRNKSQNVDTNRYADQNNKVIGMNLEKQNNNNFSEQSKGWSTVRIKGFKNVFLQQNNQNQTSRSRQVSGSRRQFQIIDHKYDMYVSKKQENDFNKLNFGSQVQKPKNMDSNYVQMHKYTNKFGKHENLPLSNISNLKSSSGNCSLKKMQNIPRLNQLNKEHRQNPISCRNNTEVCYKQGSLHFSSSGVTGFYRN